MSKYYMWMDLKEVQEGQIVVEVGESDNVLRWDFA